MRPPSTDSKEEFRAVADLSHPNLAASYELVTIDDEWFLAMELIDGVNFLEHVRSDRRAPPATDDAPTLRLRRRGSSARDDDLPSDRRHVSTIDD